MSTHLRTWMGPSMRSTLLLTLLLFSAMPSPATKCARTFHSVWPPSGPLPSNGILVLEGFAQARPIVEAVATSGAYLECSGVPIELEPTTFLRGERRRSQVQLQPEEPLPAGATCKLRVLELEDDFVTYPIVNGERVEYAWSIVDSEDLSPPTWDHPPEITSSQNTPGTSGSDVEIVFSFQVADDSPVLALAEVAPFGSGPANTYMIPIREGRFSIRYNICSAHFRLMPGSRYQIWLTAMDAAGNRSTSRSAPIVFTAPHQGSKAFQP